MSIHPSNQTPDNKGDRDEYLIVDKEDCLADGENDDVFQDDEYGFDDEDMKEEGEKERSLEHIDQSETHFKSFEKFAKFVQIEEHLFTDEKSENDSLFDDVEDKESTHTAIYNYEYGRGAYQRR
jgi:hypothetical protein